MNYEELETLEYKKVPWAIEDALRGRNALHGRYTYALAYYQHLASRFNDPTAEPHGLLDNLFREGRITEEMHAYLIEAIDRTGWTGKDFIRGRYNDNELLAYLLYGTSEEGVFGGEHSTPTGLVRLALNLLDIHEGETVADLGCGEGHFLVDGALGNPSVCFKGIDINKMAVLNSRIRVAVAEEITVGSLDVDIELMNCFDHEPESLSYDKVFFNYPLGMKFRDLQGQSACFGRMRQGLPEYGRPRSADWAFNRFMVDSLGEHGKAVGIMTPNRLSENSDNSIRAWFVDNGLIETVVLLPAGLLQGTGIPTALVVFSRGNSSVRLVDASDVCTKGRRNSTLESEDIEEIGTLCSGDESISASELGRGSAATKTLEEIACERYSLSPRRFIDGGIRIKNARRLGEVIEEVGRGVTLRASELDELSTKADTGIYYLAPADISNGVVSEMLPCLKSMDDRLSKHSLKEGAVLIARAGRPFKVAVVDVPRDTAIIPNANLFVIKLREDSIDPYYLAAFLNSELGQEVLFRASTGAAMPSLSVDDIRAIEFPMPSEEEEKDISEAYRAKLDEIRIYSSRLDRAKAELSDLFGEED